MFQVLVYILTGSNYYFYFIKRVVVLPFLLIVITKFIDDRRFAVKLW